ncbi:probable G-protein coupled receptor Mth-like 3 isoform X2 [Drosophila takahashii]|uniref:probable G-protein coupled receptor Mth-like 3 isoform X2 n=1 Tax=Drosophila takahashii TaxID=29030 RepID=UPI001CF8E742|nr:probable G-protein coupled receptor Mth-like 3 [Drosophila takahashii]
MRLLAGLLATVLLLLAHKTTADIPDCDFYDTVDISSGQKFPNGSYLHDGLLIPANLVGEYSFRTLPDGSKEAVSSHVRGCVCKLKPCIRFCCSHYHKIDDSVCKEEMSQLEKDKHDPYVNVTLSNGTVARKHFKKDLIVQSDLPMPCGEEKMHWIDHTLPGNGFTLFENGTFFRQWDEAFLDKREYCVQHFDFEANGIRMAPHFCHLDSEASPLAQSIVMVISLICMVLTISVYLYVKKLQNLHGKCFMCYMVALFMGYLFLLLNLWNVWELPSIPCTTSGILGYFSVMAAFFWLSVISLHLWNTFSGTSHSLNRYLPEHRFLAYNGYAWGMALAMTCFTILADQVIEEDWAPRMGTNQCWIYTGDNAALIYFFGPMILLIAFNITMFILTAIRIMKVKKEVRNFAQQERRNNKLSSDMRTYTFFLRLFIIMGLTWSLEIVSFLVRKNEFWGSVFQVADYLNWSQGTIIFVLFILKPSTLKLLKERIKGENNEDPDSEEQISLENTKFDPSVL